MVWAIIQAGTSAVDFDYLQYAKLRFERGYLYYKSKFCEELRVVPEDENHKNNNVTVKETICGGTAGEEAGVFRNLRRQSEEAI